MDLLVCYLALSGSCGRPSGPSRSDAGPPMVHCLMRGVGGLRTAPEILYTSEEAAMDMEIDRRAFIASLGGVAAVGAMGHEDRADALEEYMTEKLDVRLGSQFEQQVYPT